MQNEPTNILNEDQLIKLQKELAYQKEYFSEKLVAFSNKILAIAKGQDRLMSNHHCDLYEMEGRISCLVGFIKTEENRFSGKEFLIQLLTESARDTWSGRQNDNVRAFRDGQVKEAARLMLKCNVIEATQAA
jgi:hypothetical protein